MRRLLLAPLAAALTIGCSSDPPTQTSDAGPLANTCPIYPPELPDTQLRAEGTTFRDALGRIVILRGVNAGGRSKFAPFMPFDFEKEGFQAALDAYLDHAAEWGINVLRVPFSWAAVEPEPSVFDPTFDDRYGLILNGAWKRGMYTIVDFHQDIYAEVFCGDGFPAWTVPDPKPLPHHDCPDWSSKYFSDDGVRAAFDAFWADGSKVRKDYELLWKQMAKFYATPGVIGLEPMNEPGWGNQNIDAFEAGTLSTFYEEMAAELREIAPGALIFVDATGVAAGALTTGLKRPSGDGIVFAPHYYQIAALTGPGGDPDRVRLDLAKWKNVANQWQSPVLVGEFGTSNAVPDTLAYMQAHYDALDALGMSSTQWEYSAAKELWNSEDLSLVRADGTELPTAAAIVRPYPRAVAGVDVAFSYDAAKRSFTMSYTPAAGVTEIVVPPRRYPDGFDVTISGGCYDAGYAGSGRLFVSSVSGAEKVELTVVPR